MLDDQVSKLLDIWGQYDGVSYALNTHVLSGVPGIKPWLLHFQSSFLLMCLEGRSRPPKGPCHLKFLVPDPDLAVVGRETADGRTPYLLIACLTLAFKISKLTFYLKKK